jgi:hemolysin D
MPNSFPNASSVLTQQKQDEFRQFDDSYIDEPTQATNDWYYGTEELLDALPKLWTRSMLYLLVTFAAIIIPWAMLTQVDETGSARGRLEPKGATQQLGVPVTGAVKAVNVQEGATVKAGQILMQLDSDVLQTDLQQTQTKLEGLISRLSQLELLKNQLMLAINIQEQQNQAQALEKLAQVNQAQQNLDAKVSTYNLQSSLLLSRLDKRLIPHALTKN